MSTVNVRRPPRSSPPDPGSTAIELTGPPRSAESMPMTGSLGMILVPAASGVGAVLLAVTHQDRPLMAAAGLLVLAASIAVGLAMLIGSRTGDRRRTREQRERYLDHLEQVRRQARDCATRQRTSAALSHPDPREVAGMARLPGRRWERRPGDQDFLVLRAGLGTVPLSRPVVLREDATDPLVTSDAVCLAAAQDLAGQYSALPGQPIGLPLTGSTVLSIVGTADRARGVARALLAQLTWSHSPADVGVLVCSGRLAHWDWVKWLPHSLSDHARDGPLPARLITEDAARAVDLLSAELDRGDVAGPAPPRRMVVVIDRLGERAPPAAELSELAVAARMHGVHQLLLLDDRRGEPDRVDIRLSVEAATAAGAPRPRPPRPGSTIDLLDTIEMTGPGRDPAARGCRLDHLTTADAVLLARSFAPLRPGADGTDRPGALTDRESAVRPGDVAAIDPAVSWRPRAAPDLLRVPIGTAVDGLPVALDLKEAARGGMGPHGLVVGATGSGKSELLRTLVTALAISHAPRSLALLVADFKGGATFSGLAALPHLAGMITNLESDVTLIDRFRDALAGELQRRQELFAAAGRLTSLDGYLELRRRRPDLESVPRLLVIVDEFSELLGARPDLADLFVTIGRIGRSIGIHLLLATQRLDTGRIRGLESHLSYRICLRTFSEAESREAIGSPVAYHLPAEPGWAYLRADGPELRRFRAATVSRPYRPPPPDLTPSTLILPFGADNGVAQRISELRGLRPGTPGARPSPPGAGATGAASDRRPARSVLEVAVDRLCRGAGGLPDGQPVRRVWVEPLPARLTLGEVVDQDAPREVSSGCLRAVLGLVDVPERQRREVLEWDITDGAGNLLIVGAGRSGKSTAACTVLLSLARHPPGDVQLVCVDFGGGTMLPFGGLPHVAAVATRSDPDLTRRVFGRLAGMLVEREELFRRHRLASLEGFRRARAAGSVDPRVPGDVVVIVDGWAGIRDAEPSFETAVEEILGRGPGVGMHTVLTVTAPAQLRARLAAAFTRRIELRLGDAFDSVIDRHRARALPVDRPGRALVAGPHFAQLALPVLSSTGEAGPGEDPTETAVSTIRARWAGRAVERIRTLPTRVRLTDLRALAAASATPATPRPGTRSPAPLLLGLAEDDHRPVPLDPSGADPHLIIYGDSGSGKTMLLRALLAQLMPAPPPDPSSGTCPPAGPDSNQDSNPAHRADRADPVPAPRAGPGSRVLVVDPRRNLVGRNAPGFVTVSAPAEVAEACAVIAAELSRRLAGSAATDSDSVAPGGRPAIHLLVDDYDMITTATGNPLIRLLPFLPHGRDVEFHLTLARRTGGAARAQYEPLLQTLCDLGTPLLLLSGSPAEGRLAHGVVPRPLPPGRAQFAGRGTVPTLVQTPLVGGDHERGEP